jgi:hypothetical protein
MVGSYLTGPYGLAASAVSSNRVIARGNLEGRFSGCFGTAASPGDLMMFAADGAAADHYTFDACSYGGTPVAIADWDPNQSANIDAAHADGDTGYFYPYEEGIVWRGNYKDNVSIVPGNKLVVSATAGKLDKFVCATLTGTTPFGFSSGGAAVNGASGSSVINYVVAVSWSSVASVSSRSAATQIWAQARSW